MAVLLGRAGHRIVAVSGRGPTRDRASRFLSDVPFLDPADAARAGELVLIGVPDDEIPAIVGQIAGAGGFRSGQWVAHLSGASGLDVLSPGRAAGARPLALHPLQTFPDVAGALERLPGCAMAVTAEDAEGYTVGERIADDLMARPFRLDDAMRPLYHAAAVFASNYLIVASGIAEDLFRRAGVPDPLERDASAAAREPGQRGTPGPGRGAHRTGRPRRRHHDRAQPRGAPRIEARRRRRLRGALPRRARARIRSPAACRRLAARRSKRCWRDGADPRRRRSHGGRRRTPILRRRRRARADDGSVARRSRLADPPRPGRAGRGRRVDLREPDAVRARRGPVSLSEGRGPRRRHEREPRRRPGVGPIRGRVLSPRRRAPQARNRARSAMSWRARRDPVTSPGCWPPCIACSTWWARPPRTSARRTRSSSSSSDGWSNGSSCRSRSSRAPRSASPTDSPCRLATPTSRPRNANRRAASSWPSPRRRSSRAGERDPAVLVAAMAREVGATPLASLDYAAVVDEATFEPPAEVDRPARALIAARFPSARLIDNLRLPAAG